MFPCRALLNGSHLLTGCERFSTTFQSSRSCQSLRRGDRRERARAHPPSSFPPPPQMVTVRVDGELVLTTEVAKKTVNPIWTDASVVLCVHHSFSKRRRPPPPFSSLSSHARPSFPSLSTLSPDSAVVIDILDFKRLGGKKAAHPSLGKIFVRSRDLAGLQGELKRRPALFCED